MDNLPTIAITEEMLKPLVEGVVANVGVILPIGLACLQSSSASASSPA